VLALIQHCEMLQVGAVASIETASQLTSFKCKEGALARACANAGLPADGLVGARGELEGSAVHRAFADQGALRRLLLSRTSCVPSFSRLNTQQAAAAAAAAVLSAGCFLSPRLSAVAH
jgi:hypothetical protein